MSDIKAFGEILPGVRYVDRPGAYAFVLNEKQELAVVKTPVGLFLPGGGLDPGEDELTGLGRELQEELGWELKDALFLVSAAQYHWSEFYKSHFKKIGSFFECQVHCPPNAKCADEHTLLWMPPEEAERVLSQEFQRWAVNQYWFGLS